MIKIGKNYDGVTMYLTDEEFMDIVNGKASIKGTNQQRARTRKLVTKYKKGKLII